jgi:hypothetical protein
MIFWGRLQSTNLKTILWLQTLYFFLLSVWPILHMQSFEKVSGPKKNDWLVKTVSVLLIADSICFASALFTDAVSLPVILLAITSAAALLLIDLIYVLKKNISRVYLFDAVIEFAFIFSLLIASWKSKS